MQLTERSINKFKILYSKNFGEELSGEDLRRRAENLVELYRIMYDLPSVADSSKEEIKK